MVFKKPIRRKFSRSRICKKKSPFGISPWSDMCICQLNNILVADSPCLPGRWLTFQKNKCIWFIPWCTALTVLELTVPSPGSGKAPVLFSGSTTTLCLWQGAVTVCLPVFLPHLKLKNGCATSIIQERGTFAKLQICSLACHLTIGRRKMTACPCLHENTAVISTHTSKKTPCWEAAMDSEHGCEAEEW